jgi:hypothetical protein
MNKKLWMKLLGLLIVGTLTTAFSGCVPSVEVSQEKFETFSLSGDLDLMVKTDNGNITLRGQDGLSEVQVKATLKAWAMSDGEAESLLQEIPLTMTQTGNRVELRVDPRPQFGIIINTGYSVNFEVVMPSSALMNIETDNGAVDIENVTGSLKTLTDNGRIRLFNVIGDLDLETDNGSIDIQGGLGSLHARTDNGNVSYSGRLLGPNHSVETDNGNITLYLPSDSALQIDAEVDNGSLSSDLPLQGELRNHSWSAVLNAPDATLRLRTDNGSIRLRALIE